MDTQDFLSLETDFNLLSLADLLAAREHFHIHLSHKPNVVATAIGRYRIRKDDPWPDKDSSKCVSSSEHSHTPRTLENSEIRPYSWPAILVFVEKWVDINDFSHPEDVVPPAVYMPNGQKVPICVIQVEKSEIVPADNSNYNFPASVMGGGYPVICDVQGKEHIGSVACLVSNGHKVFALTNRHVAGEMGTPISAIIGNKKERIGCSAPLGLSRLSFEHVYPGWQGSHMYVDLDVSNISLRLIGCPVVAYGAASGRMHGEICALFYQFKSIGGFDFVADVLIGPKKDSKSLGTHPGDSGTLWLIETDENKLPRPIALQWGGQVFLEGGNKASSYSLATFLSTVCNELDVTLLRGWNTGLPEYWGAVGHYSIATKACDAIRNTKLKNLMRANLERISFAVPDINKKNLTGLSKDDFVPLADVPDLVWKIGPYRRGGQTAPEHSNHFADMDRVLDPPLPQGATLLEICRNKPENVSVEVWQQYYDAVEELTGEAEGRGILPFRVWQIYQTMVAAVRTGDVATYVCAAGILAHYVGDSCQPLHISYMFNGDPDRTVRGTIRDEETGEKREGDVARGHGVHSAYENYMIDRHVPEVIAGIDDYLSRNSLSPFIRGGHSAAVAVVDLMQKTHDRILPQEIIDEYDRTQDEKPAPRADALWERFGDDTVIVMAEGCLCLARLWESAWIEGNGDRHIDALDAIDEATLAALYQDRHFLPSHTLGTIGGVLQGGPASSPISEADRETEPEI